MRKLRRLPATRFICVAGTYFLNNSNITATNNSGPYNIVNNMTKSGISYLAYPGELPIFDFSNVKPATNRGTAFLVTANNCVFEGFDVVGVQVTIAGTHTQSENFPRCRWQQ